MFQQKTFKNGLPTIYLVTTPIGNLDDITLRALEVLKKVELIYCEDTRTSSILLKHFNIETQTRSLHKFNELEKVEQIFSLLEQGNDLAIISDAGVPCINDPGSFLLEYLLEHYPNQFNISAVGAGPAYVHALIASGFKCEKHFYLGFLEKKVTKIEEELKAILTYAPLNETVSVCFYESVHRIKKTLQIIEKFFSNQRVRICVAREITKVNEEFTRLDNSEINSFINNDLMEKGEFCVVLNFQNKRHDNVVDNEKIILLANDLIANGIRKKDALKELAKKYQFDIQEIYKKM